MACFHLKTPLSETEVRELQIGDIVYLSGPVFTGRSRIHRYVFDEGHALPCSTAERNAMIHVGPIVTGETGRWKLISFMPTSSLRFEKWGTLAVERWKLRMIVGKTSMGQSTMDAMQSFGCVHVSPQCVSPNLWKSAIRIEDVRLFDELGSIEATWLFRLCELGPFIVDIDAQGQNLFERLDAQVASRRLDVLKSMGIKEGFQPTRLY